MQNRPPVIYTTMVPPEWLDYNQHMNVVNYVRAFDLAVEELLRSLGLGQTVAETRYVSVMALEAHITYDREVSLGQRLEVRWQLVDHDSKRLHLYLEMHVLGEDGYRAARLEQLLLCVNLKQRHATTFPQEVETEITRLALRHADLPRPDSLGRKIGIRR